MSTHVSWIAIVVAAIASVFWGWLWHTWVCGKKWASDCGMHHSMDKKETRIATLLSFIAALLTAYIISRLLALAHAAHVMPDGASYKYGICVAFSVWIGFYVPMTLHATAWLKKQWHFFIPKIINQLINLLVIALILAYWKTIV